MKPKREAFERLCSVVLWGIALSQFVNWRVVLEWTWALPYFGILLALVLAWRILTPIWLDRIESKVRLEMEVVHRTQIIELQKEVERLRDYRDIHAEIRAAGPPPAPSLPPVAEKRAFPPTAEEEAGFDPPYAEKFDALKELRQEREAREAAAADRFETPRGSFTIISGPPPKERPEPIRQEYKILRTTDSEGRVQSRHIVRDVYACDGEMHPYGHCSTCGYFYD